MPTCPERGGTGGHGRHYRLQGIKLDSGEDVASLVEEIAEKAGLRD
jgi:hypothetical protein